MKTIQKNKNWQFLFDINKSYTRMADTGWHTFQFGIFKIHSFPDGGATLGSKDYKGFIIRFMFWFPIDNY